MTVLFLIVAIIAIGAAIGMLLSENAVHSALFLILNFGCVAFLFLMLDAPFLSMVQIAVYAGAIMVLFLFVIMLLGAENTTDTSRSFRWATGLGLVSALLFVVILGVPLAAGQLNIPKDEIASDEGDAFIRVIHVADITPERPSVDIELLGPETVSIVDLGVADVSSAEEFEAVESGDYAVSVAIYSPAGDAVPVINETFTLSPDQAYTIITTGSFSEGTFAVQALEEDLTPVEGDVARLVVVNTLNTAVQVADIGLYTTVNTLCDGACPNTLPFSRLSDFIPAGEVGTVEIYDGDYNLAFINEELDVLRAIEFEAEEGIVETRILTLEPAQLGGEPRIVALGLSALSASAFGSPQAIGEVLFTDYLLPVQLVGMLLLVALVGVLVLALPESVKSRPRPTRRRVSRPLVSVITDQTGTDVLQEDIPPQLPDSPQPETGD